MARVFAVMVQVYIEGWSDRGTILINGWDFIPMHEADKLAVEQRRLRNLSRSQEFVQVQVLIGEQLRVSRCSSHHNPILGAGAKQKP